jgi:hypothetical protein
MVRTHAGRPVQEDSSERDGKVNKLNKMREDLKKAAARKGSGAQDATDALQEAVDDLQAELGAGARPDPRFTFTGTVLWMPELRTFASQDSCVSLQPHNGQEVKTTVHTDAAQHSLLYDSELSYPSGTP